VRLVFFGLPLAALLLARDGHEVRWAAICRRGAIGTRRLTRLLGRGRVAVHPDLEGDEAFCRVCDARPELLVSWFWTKKIPARLLALAPSVGVHPSLLPRHRGPDPTFWAIDAGDDVTGVTAHRLEVEYDTGPILGQRTLAIDPEWNGWKLARALDRPGLALLREIVAAHAEGRPPRGRLQDEARATDAPQPSDEDLAIRWSWPAERVARRVRAAAPWPGAWTEIGDELVTLLRVRATADFPRALAAGEAAVRADGIAIVRAGTDAVELLEARGEDDRPLSEAQLARIVQAVSASAGDNANVDVAGAESS
jgi:methionyl-tRNA formyltransferase